MALKVKRGVSAKKKVAKKTQKKSVTKARALSKPEMVRWAKKLLRLQRELEGKK